MCRWDGGGGGGRVEGRCKNMVLKCLTRCLFVKFETEKKTK